MNTILHALFIPAALLIVVVVGFPVCGFLFYTCKKQFAAIGNVLTRRGTDLEALSARLDWELGTLRERLEFAEDRTGALVPPAPPPSGLNLAKRSQALRMLNHGAEPASIAAALAVPAPEVALLARVRALVAKNTESFSGSAVSGRGHSGLFRGPSQAQEGSSG